MIALRLSIKHDPLEPPHKRGIKPAPAPAAKVEHNRRLLFNRSWVSRDEALHFGVSKEALKILVRGGDVRLVPHAGIFPRYDRHDLDAAIVSGSADEAEREVERREEEAA